MISLVPSTLLLILLNQQNAASPVGNFSDFKQECSSIIRDVVFILDATASISKADFQLAQQFTAQIIKFIKASNYENRIAFIVFGNSADIVFDFDKTSSIDEMIKDVEATKNQNEHTAIGKALNLTLIELLPTMRTTADKLVILLTDGTNTIYPAPYIYAEKFKSKGVKISTIGIGPDINSKNLTSIATAGQSITFNDFTELINSKNQITRQIFQIQDATVSMAFGANYDSQKQCCFPNKWGARLIDSDMSEEGMNNNEIYYDYSQRTKLVYFKNKKVYHLTNETFYIDFYENNHTHGNCGKDNDFVPFLIDIGRPQCIGINNGYEETERSEEFVELRTFFVYGSRKNNENIAMKYVMYYKFKINNCKFVSLKKVINDSDKIYETKFDGDYLDTTILDCLSSKRQKYCKISDK